jgi:hypothetical protein
MIKFNRFVPGITLFILLLVGMLSSSAVNAHPVSTAQAHHFDTSAVSCSYYPLSAKIWYGSNQCQGFTGYGYIAVRLYPVTEIQAFAQMWIKIYTTSFPNGLYCYIPAGGNVGTTGGATITQEDPGGNQYGYCPNPIE